MTDSTKMDAAIARLDKAMELFEMSVVKDKKSFRTQQSLEAQLSDLTNDRSRLAEQLDEANARASRLSEANVDAKGRVDAVMDNIRLLLSGV